MEQTLIIVGIGAGIVVNLMALLGLIWKFGSWSGRVTALLEDHQKDLTQHDKRIGQAERDISEMRGWRRA